MTFDNSKTIISLRIRLFVVTVLLLAWLAVVYVAQLIEFPVLGISDTIATIVLVAIYLLIALWPMFRNYQYVFFSDDDEYIVLRYFFSGLTGGRKNSITIEKKAFAGYKYVSKYSGLVKSLILYQKTGQGIAKYPPVYISALSHEQRNMLLQILNRYTPKT
ncbi:MAG TPA: hypothetical protein PLV06_08830 [Bacteroidales bacterium]|nr:hypothetical protein [Bacteroidales bacterium]HPF03167.1 hypothetical protein [Bacteroidales bacterium]HPJ58129.1 hypothetical protein [Bacteroidales bacterium]HPR12474.1 hypothetical protein [Bacteroidales bacterium]HRW84539.1 hypothetical protein [Bacteroidales bacterium]